MVRCAQYFPRSVVNYCVAALEDAERAALFELQPRGFEALAFRHKCAADSRVEGNEALLQYEIDCLPKLAELIRLGRFEPYIDTEVDFELAWLDLGALINTELSFFHGITLRKVPDPFPYGHIVASSHHTVKELDELRQHIFATDFDERFNEIKQAAGGNKNADAFHILSAERAGFHCGSSR